MAKQSGVEATPETRYARHDDDCIAFQVVGTGPPDILFIRSAWNQVEMQWEDPKLERFLRRLSSMGRLMVFDPRGCGLSDGFSSASLSTYEDWADDALAVMDAVGSERAAVVTVGFGAPRATHMAAAYPARVSHLVYINGVARLLWARDHPWAPDEETYLARISVNAAHWGLETSPNLAALDAELARWIAKYRRHSVAPGFFRRFVEQLALQTDVRHVLPAIQAATLVMHHPEAPGVPDVRQHSRYIADHIPGAEYLALPGPSPVLEWRFEDPDGVATEIERFVLGRETAHEPDRVLATVLFTDIVDSTRAAVEAGDRKWREVLDSLDRLVSRDVERFRGRVVKSTGDGHLVTFDGPGRAIRCASSLLERAGSLGIQIRAGLHTGEVEVRGRDIGGIAVSIARRVCDVAADGRVFVSSAVPPLVAGSDIVFGDRGRHELKGVPDTWQLYEVASA